MIFKKIKIKNQLKKIEYFLFCNMYFLNLVKNKNKNYTMNQKQIIEKTLIFIKDEIEELENKLSVFETNTQFDKEKKSIILKICINKTIMSSLKKYFQQHEQELLLNLNFDVSMFSNKLLDEVDFNLDLIADKINMRQSEQHYKNSLRNLLGVFLSRYLQT
jgi:hypothetical protein